MGRCECAKQTLCGPKKFNSDQPKNQGLGSFEVNPGVVWLHTKMPFRLGAMAELRGGQGWSLQLHGKTWSPSVKQRITVFAMFFHPMRNLSFTMLISGHFYCAQIFRWITAQSQVRCSHWSLVQTPQSCLLGEGQRWVGLQDNPHRSIPFSKAWFSASITGSTLEGWNSNIRSGKNYVIDKEELCRITSICILIKVLGWQLQEAELSYINYIN